MPNTSTQLLETGFRARLPSGMVLLKSMVFVACLLPTLLLFHALLNDKLGANPIEALSRETGEWTLRFLLLSLLATPLQQQFRWFWPIKLRRMIGLFAFFYAALHTLIYVGLDQQFDWPLIVSSIVEKPYLLAGMLSLLILVPLAVTSTRKMQRRVGKYWKPLHRGVYVASLAGCLHFVWLGKGNIPEPLIYTGILLFLLLWRFLWLVRNS